MGSNPLAQKVGAAAAMGAALTMGCSSDSSPGPQAQSDAATGDDALSDVFQDGSPEDIAQQLEAMVDGGNPTPDAAPLYKGVSFP